MKVRKILPTRGSNCDLHLRMENVIVSIAIVCLIATDEPSLGSRSKGREIRIFIHDKGSDSRILQENLKEKEKSRKKKLRYVNVTTRKKLATSSLRFQQKYIFFNFIGKSIKTLTGTKRFQKTLLVNKSSSSSSEENPFKSHFRNYVS